MTVAALILLPSLDAALAEIGGRPAARRMVESAWAGGATPIIVVSLDEGGRLAATLAGSPAVLAEPAPGGVRSVGQLVRGMRLAADQVSETDAVLAWPGEMVWVDAETVTTLIEAHGAARDVLLRPGYSGGPGWPALLPVTFLERLAGLPPEGPLDELPASLEQAGAALRQIETGDPGIVHDASTALEALPAFEGPPEPAGGPPPEWGASAADFADDGPLQGPSLAPYDQAADEDR